MAAGQHKGSRALPLGGGGASSGEGLDFARQRPSTVLGMILRSFDGLRTGEAQDERSEGFRGVHC